MLKYATFQITKMLQKRQSRVQFFIKNSRNRQNNYLELGLYSANFDKNKAMNKLFLQRINRTEDWVTVELTWRLLEVLNCIAIVGCHFPFFNLDFWHFLLAMLALKLDWCWDEELLTNHKMITTLSAYTLLVYTDQTECNSVIGMTTPALVYCIDLLFCQR